ncbi:2-dehydro-3-deoxygalactonokinase [Tsukamurella soli]|uniref:2-dehydro-3-deoxygalactonokinase n=1 Tax=Tsukamurella soli TaxID=644556 RepID=A0ABP8JUS7_9ACTN
MTVGGPTCRAGEAALVAVDWGTTSCRAYAMSASGEVLAEVDRPAGVGSVTGSAAERHAEFERVLASILDSLGVAAGSVPTVLGGMIGSSAGWLEVPTREVPCRLDGGRDLVEHRTGRGHTVYLVRGLHQGGDVPGLIRGEEAQLMAVADERDRIVILPGSHSKWVLLTGNRVESFATFMTGEVLAAVSEHTILRAFAARPDRAGGSFSTAAFARGLELAESSRGGLLADLFAARTLPLAGSVAPAETYPLLCGIVIGHELSGGLEIHRRYCGRPITIVARAEILEEYRIAFAAKGIAVEAAPPEAAALGMWRIARSHGLVDGRHP